MEERIQKIMSRAGLGSRRDCEELIAAGRVKVNGIRAILGTKADPAVDSIVVDGTELSRNEPERVYIALNKPRNVLSDSDPDDPRQNVRDLVPVPGHLFTVGRLDFESEGLILMTNDGDLANKLTHPRYGHEKEYRVLLASPPDDEQLGIWRRGVVLEDGARTLPAEVFIDSRLGKGAWVRVVMREGRKRQIREICKRIGLPVVRILRVRIGTLRLGDLKPREWRNLTPEEINTLRSLQEQSRARRNHVPGRQSEDDEERHTARKRRPYSPHKTSGTGTTRRPKTGFRRDTPPRDDSGSSRKSEPGGKWQPKTAVTGDSKVRRQDSVSGSPDEKRELKPAWKPNSNRKQNGTGGRSPSTRTGSKPSTRTPRKTEHKP